jgi:hypothetical protein
VGIETAVIVGGDSADRKQQTTDAAENIGSGGDVVKISVSAANVRRHGDHLHTVADGEVRSHGGEVTLVRRNHDEVMARSGKPMG